MKGRKGVLLGVAIILFCSGCGVGMKESLRGVAGVSTKVLEDNLSSANSKEFNLDYGAADS
jgi:hypothetical protein